MEFLSKWNTHKLSSREIRHSQSAIRSPQSAIVSVRGNKVRFLSGILRLQPNIEQYTHQCEKDDQRRTAKADERQWQALGRQQTHGYRHIKRCLQRDQRNDAGGQQRAEQVARARGDSQARDEHDPEERKSDDPCATCPDGYFPVCKWNLPALLANSTDAELTPIAHALAQETTVIEKIPAMPK